MRQSFKLKFRTCACVRQGDMGVLCGELGPTGIVNGNFPHYALVPRAVGIDVDAEGEGADEWAAEAAAEAAATLRYASKHRSESLSPCCCCCCCCCVSNQLHCFCQDNLQTTPLTERLRSDSLSPRSLVVPFPCGIGRLRRAVVDLFDPEELPAHVVRCCCRCALCVDSVCVSRRSLTVCVALWGSGAAADRHHTAGADVTDRGRQ
jgi:hypothetical protein